MFRAMRRIKQQISDEECVEILNNAKRGVLAVLGDEDYPYTIPLDYVYSDGHIYFHSAKTGHKLDAVKKHDKVSFCVLNEGVQEKDDWWFHFISVVAFGRIRVVENNAERIEFLRLLGRKYFPTAEMVEEDIKKDAARAEVLDLSIEHMTGKRVREN